MDGMTKVNDCETNRELAFKLNEMGSRTLGVISPLCFRH